MLLRLLLVEDSADDAELILRELRKGGFQLESQRVSDAGSFRKALEARAWDLVISDFHLPGFGGLMALEIFQTSGLDIPFVMVSGVLGEEAAVAAIKAGAHEFVLKDKLVRLCLVVERELRDAGTRREQRKDKLALRESEARYRALFQHSPVPVRVEDYSEVFQFFESWRQEGVQDFRRFFEEHPEALFRCADAVRIREENQASLDFFHSPGEDLCRDSLSSIFCEESWAVFREEMIALAMGENQFQSQIQIQHPDASTHTLSLRLSVIPEYQPPLGRVMVSFMDITHLVETEASLRESQSRLEKAMEIAQMGSWEWDLATNHRTMSSRLQRLFGLEESEEALDYDRYIEMIHSEDRARVLGGFEEAIASGRGMDLSYRILQAGGEIRHIHEMAEVLQDASGRSTRLWGIAQDVTERVRLESECRDLEKLSAKGQMSAYIAHEINNPLAGIKNAFLLLEEAIPEDHPHRHYAGLIKREIDRIAGIIRTMYHVYRPYSNESRDISLSQAFEDIESLMIPKCRAQGVEMALDLEDPRLRVHANEGLLRQVLFNLVQNATEASPRDSIITLGARGGSEDILITIRDQGSGIPPQLSARIFEAGFTTKQGPGTKGLGLGLSTCKSIVESMGGSLDFVSNSAEGGTVFLVRLPAVAVADQGGRS